MVEPTEEFMRQHGRKWRTKDDGDVVRATKVDLSEILGWLEREYIEDGEGFWCNRGVISRSLEYGDLWVVRDRGGAVAFQVGDYGTDIVCVRKDLRGHGYGTELVNFSFARAIEDNVNVLSGECSPRSSWPFWKKMGFEQYGKDPSIVGPIPIRKALHRRHGLSASLPRMEVRISFFREDALYSESVSPIEVHRLTGGFIDGRVRLPCRVIGLASDAHPGDLVVKVVVDGGERCFCKAKYDEAKAAGVKYDRIGHSFYLDETAIET